MQADELTPRERVCLALLHRGTDRVPVDFMATPEAWGRLQKHLGLDDPEAVLRCLGIDIRHPRQPYGGPPIVHHSDGSWVDAWRVRRRVYHDGGAYDEIVEHPLATLRDLSELAAFPWPCPEWWDAAALAEQIHHLRTHGDYAITLEEFGDPGGIFEIAWYLRGMEQFMLDMVTQPALADEIMHHVADFYLGLLERVIAAAVEQIDLIWTSDDIAHQHGMLISFRAWRELIAPHYARLNRRIHELGTRAMCHCYGSVRPFLPGLVDIRVDVLDVLQFSADQMNPAEIRTQFGDKLCFHGGMDVQSTFPMGTEDDVRRVARERIQVLGRDGGYILAPTHNIQVDSSPVDIVATYEEAGSTRVRERGGP